MLKDALSQAPAPNSDMLVSPATDDAETHINMVTASLPKSDVMLQQIVQEKAKDPLLQKVSHHIQNGWSKRPTIFLTNHFGYGGTLSAAGDLLVKKTNHLFDQPFWIWWDTFCSRGSSAFSCTICCNMTCVWLMDCCCDKTGLSSHNPCVRTCFSIFMRDIWAWRNVKGEREKAVYWPGINIDIEEMIQKCETCLKHVCLC